MRYKEQIESYCRQLKFGSRIIKDIDIVKAETNEEFLMKLFQKEVEYRRSTRIARNLKGAGFYSMKTFEDYDFSAAKLPAGIDRDDVKNCSFTDEKKNLILYGNVGTGKTHMAIAIGVESCRQGKKVKFFRTAALVNKLADLKKTGSLQKFLQELSKTDLLICDEWGYVPLDRDGSRLLFEVISECYEQRSVIITTNLEFSRWVSIIYDEQMTAAIIDRLVHHSYLIMFEGESWRMKHSLMKQ